MDKHQLEAEARQVLSACVKCGTEIELVADGTDEAQALQDMVNAVNSGLGE